MEGKFEAQKVSIIKSDSTKVIYKSSKIRKFNSKEDFEIWRNKIIKDFKLRYPGNGWKFEFMTVDKTQKYEVL